MANRRIDEPTGVETVGHEWDGIEELNNPLPRWWLIVLAMTVVFSIGYVVVYPAFPMLSSASKGVWGWSSRGDLAKEMDQANTDRLPVLNAISASSYDAILGDPKLLAQAKAGGKAAFKNNCAQCHGSDGKGSQGYPNLTDNDWLWGGDLANIELTLQHGVRSPDDKATRTSQMPNFGKDGILQPAQVGDVVAHVRSLSGAAPVNAAAMRGSQIYAANCAVCHGPQGTGNRQLGAPNLADQVWLFGGSKDQVAASVNVANAGVMPAWNTKLDPVTIKMLTIYVHSLGGGERFAAPVPAASAPAPASGTGNGKP